MGKSLLGRSAALALALVAGTSCSKAGDSSSNQVVAQPAIEPGSDATPTNDASFQLLDADLPTRLATLQGVVMNAGKRCASATRGVLMGGLDGTDEWRVDCTDSGSWQVWFSNDSGTEVDHCANAKCS